MKRVNASTGGGCAVAASVELIVGVSSHERIVKMKQGAESVMLMESSSSQET
jgi:hypothetical protein